jgi:hypothetical protein
MVGGRLHRLFGGVELGATAGTYPQSFENRFRDEIWQSAVRATRHIRDAVVGTLPDFLLSWDCVTLTISRRHSF